MIVLALCCLLLSITSQIHGFQCPASRNVISMKDIQRAVTFAEHVYYSPNMRVGTIVHGYRVAMVHNTNTRPDGVGIRVFVAHKNKETIVTFRGTDSNKQVLNQIVKQFQHMSGRSYKIAGVWTKVGAYTLNAFHLLYYRLRPHLGNPRRKYILTGHSLGGALASLLALKMTTQYRGSIWRHPQSSLITFGMPRVGNAAYANLHDKLISPWRKLRFVLNRDPIPNVPFKPKFRHHSREIYMDRKLYTKCFWCNIRWRKFWRICKTKDDSKCGHNFKWIPNPKAHLIENYRKYILHPPNRYEDIHRHGKRSFKSALLSSC